MLKDTLLMGKGTGGSLFLAWSVGLLAVFPVSFLIETFLAAQYHSRWNAFLVSLIAFSIWQAILLLAHWRRRFLWIAVSLAVIISMIDSDGFTLSLGDLLFCLSIASFFQTLLLSTIRIRSILWFVGFFLGLLEYESAKLQLSFYYQVAWSFLVNYNYKVFTAILPQFDEIYLTVLYGVLGLVVAFVMPPCPRENDATKGQ